MPCDMNCPEFKIIGEAQSVAEAVEVINQKNPDLIFLDIRLMDGLGFEVLERIENSFSQRLIVNMRLQLLSLMP